MSIKEFLIRLHLCLKVGKATEAKIYRYLCQMQQIPSLADLGMILHNFKFATHIYHKINSNELTDLLKKTLAIANVITIFDEDYPLKLREIYQAPLVLFYQGNIQLLHQPLLAVVGARQNSNYSDEALQQILPPIIQQKITTISGLAQGVDSLCHRLTINHGGKTIGVIGTGLNRTYPQCNQKLQKEMMQNHLVISEYAYDAVPKAFHFPERNRIIAGLCDSLLVVEAKERSGSLITANLALQENRNVLAIPGKISAPLSRGCNLLIREGAKPIIDAQDVIEEFLFK